MPMNLGRQSLAWHRIKIGALWLRFCFLHPDFCWLCTLNVFQCNIKQRSYLQSSTSQRFLPRGGCDTFAQKLAQKLRCREPSATKDG
jgi:hypothetical protein